MAYMNVVLNAASIAIYCIIFFFTPAILELFSLLKPHS